MADKDSTDWGMNTEVATPPPPAPPSLAPPALRAHTTAADVEEWVPDNETSRPQTQFTEEDFDDTEKEPFDRPDVQKLGIIGGKGVGKSYLFQAMVYRVLSSELSGAMTQFIERDNVTLFTSSIGAQITDTGSARPLNRARFVEKYEKWLRLPQTQKTDQRWYRLRLPYRTGWLGRKQTAMDVEFFDGSGEGLFQLESLSAAEWKIWEKAYGPATVMVFCLPLWAAFPGSDLTEEDWEVRDALLTGFEQVLTHYKELRRRIQNPRVASILALTAADDRRSALRTLYTRWIVPYLDSAPNHLAELRKGSGIARYLNNARRVSEALRGEFLSARRPSVSAIPRSLDFGKGLPWIVPLSAIDGTRLDYLEHVYPNPDDPARLREIRENYPIPIHVELPLLVALCERENALM